ETVYDPCCGSGGLLIKCHLRLLQTQGKKENGRLRLPKKVAPLKLFGQEINASTFAMARMNAFLHDMEADIRVGDTMHRPAFTAGEPDPFRRGCIVHELLHLKVPRHGTLFRSMLKAYLAQAVPRPPPESRARWAAAE